MKNLITGQPNDAANAGEAVGSAAYGAGDAASKYAQDAKNKASGTADQAGKYAKVCVPHPTSHCKYDDIAQPPHHC